MAAQSAKALREIEHRFTLDCRWQACQPTGGQRKQLKRTITYLERLSSESNTFPSAIRPSIDVALNRALV